MPNQDNRRALSAIYAPDINLSIDNIVVTSTTFTHIKASISSYYPPLATDTNDGLLHTQPVKMHAFLVLAAIGGLFGIGTSARQEVFQITVSITFDSAKGSKVLTFHSKTEENSKHVSSRGMSTGSAVNSSPDDGKSRIAKIPYIERYMLMGAVILRWFHWAADIGFNSMRTSWK